MSILESTFISSRKGKRASRLLGSPIPNMADYHSQFNSLNFSGSLHDWHELGSALRHLRSAFDVSLRELQSFPTEKYKLEGLGLCCRSLEIGNPRSDLDALPE